VLALTFTIRLSKLFFLKALYWQRGCYISIQMFISFTAETRQSPYQLSHNLYLFLADAVIY
jgi:hypothetical protein